ncbi:MAG: hypothetical protein OEV44_05530 [Spirochaetota bacterium]|nr:hypothetical protein [Spirochaetota bacterium]
MLKFSVTLISLSLLVSQLVYPLDPPKFPEIPKPPDFKNLLNQTPKKKTENTESYIYEVEIVLNKGSRIKGSISLKKNHITALTKKGDFTYSKDIELSEVKKIEILQWKESKAKKTSESAKILFIFYPIKFKVITIKKKTFIFDGRLPQFEMVKLTNILGKTTIYSIFYDYWTVSGKGGKWNNSKSTKFEHNRTHPHPLSFKEIVFKKKT